MAERGAACHAEESTLLVMVALHDRSMTNVSIDLWNGWTLNRHEQGGDTKFIRIHRSLNFFADVTVVMNVTLTCCSHSHRHGSSIATGNTAPPMNGEWGWLIDGEKHKRGLCSFRLAFRPHNKKSVNFTFAHQTCSRSPLSSLSHFSVP